ncbi:hypothetical protein EDD22DRAFT_848083 [Suillus occidentalis]|nr:hypothetical protein EDD22DRAFT_848083 [Suillus occidentalis]
MTYSLLHNIRGFLSIYPTFSLLGIFVAPEIYIQERASSHNIPFYITSPATLLDMSWVYVHARLAAGRLYHVTFTTSKSIKSFIALQALKTGISTMNPALMKIVDGKIFEFGHPPQVVCNVCPMCNGALRTMHLKHVLKHSATSMHQRHAKNPPALKVHPLPERYPLEGLSCTGSNNNNVLNAMDFATSCDAFINIDDPDISADHDVTIDSDSDPVVPVSELWNAMSSSCFYNSGVNETCDLFDELQCALTSGESLFSMPLAPMTEEVGFDDETESNFGIELADDPLTTKSHVNLNNPVSPDHPTFPWPSKAHFITALLFSSPRLPFSEAQKKAILSWAKELGARDVPSLYALNRSQETIQKLVGDPTEKVTARSGNIFYFNDVGKAVAKDYPEDGGKGMSQVFNGEKMLFELPSPPAAKVDGEIYFINELLQDSSGDYFLPQRFFFASYGSSSDTADKLLHALGRAVQRTEDGFIVGDEQEIIPTSTFRRSFRELSLNDSELTCGLTESSKKYAKLEPNLLRARSQGRMVYAVPLIIFMDDVSGNISKQWNKHHAIYMSNANLPREMLEKEFCVRFVTSSPHAAPMEMMSAMQDSIGKAAESGIFAWDCKDNEEVMLVPYSLFLGGDNPMHAEETCEVGGTKEYKESDKGYNSIFVPGQFWTPAGTAAEIRAQFVTALNSGTSEKIKKSISSTGVKDTTTGYILEPKSESEVKAILNKELEDLLRGSALDDAINPLLGVEGFNVHQDTPTEILHTVLLGVVKYFWGQTVFLLEKAKLLDLFQTRLDSIAKDGLNSPCLNADYICHYKGSLIGKHFKSLAQVMPFLIQDLLPITVLNGWTIICELVVHIWHTKIDDTELYLAKLSRTIEDFLNVTAQCAPSILISKPKFHFLVHLPAYIRRFGPAILFSTERYESFNHVFRLACIHSNRQGPSQDTCKIFARQDIVKHIATGGYWFDAIRKRWAWAGDKVLSYVDEHPEQARLLGIHMETSPITGTGQLKKVATEDGHSVAEKPVMWTTTRCAKALDLPPSATIQYYHGISLVIGNGEKATLGGHVIFHDSSTSSSGVGRVREILITLLFKSLLLDPPYIPYFTSRLLSSPTMRLSLAHKTSFVSSIFNTIASKHGAWTLVNAVFFKNEPRLRIQSVIPQSIRETPLRVTNAADVRLVAARQIREKKAAKKAGEIPGAASASALPDEVARVSAVFDRSTVKAASKPKPAPKAKEKASRPHANPRHPMIAQSAASSSSHLTTPPTAPVASGSSQVPSAPIPPQPMWMHPPTMVPSQWQQSPIPSFRAPPSHHLPLQQLPPIPSPLASIPQPHFRQYYHPQPMLTGYHATPPYQHSLGPALPLQPSAPVLTPNVWGPQAPHPFHHDQFRRH